MCIYIHVYIYVYACSCIYIHILAYTIRRHVRHTTLHARSGGFEKIPGRNTESNRPAKPPFCSCNVIPARDGVEMQLPYVMSETIPRVVKGKKHVFAVHHHPEIVAFLQRDGAGKRMDNFASSVDTAVAREQHDSSILKERRFGHAYIIRLLL